jgi:NADPH:quinone reductase-like Zn-dependent oxidoreductase
MRALQITRFGGPEVLDVVDLPTPSPARASNCSTSPLPA